MFLSPISCQSFPLFAMGGRGSFLPAHPRVSAVNILLVAVVDRAVDNAFVRVVSRLIGA
jgi:hypothetical protein